MEKKVLLLDMNSTFMFGEDRFTQNEDFSSYYTSIGGMLPNEKVNDIIRAAYNYLDVRYTDVKFQNSFPSLESAIDEVSGETPGLDEMEKLIKTFAHHEMGYIPDDYVSALKNLKQRFKLAAVIDIWAPKQSLLDYFTRLGIYGLFSAYSFSSDHGMVKPSAGGYERVLKKLGAMKEDALVIGDSVRRDLGGARNAGLDCILVGGARHEAAIGCYASMLDFCEAVKKQDSG